MTLSRGRQPSDPLFSSPDNTRAKAGEHGVRASFTGTNGNPLLPPSPSMPRVLRLLHLTPRPTPDAIFHFTLPELLDWVDESVDWQEAQIFSTESYTEWTGRVKHRFLVLQLQRLRDLTDACLRLDRLRSRNISILIFLFRFGATEANDRATFTIRKDEVIQGGTRENRQIFEVLPTLRELRVLLRIVREELGGYQLWPKNCWAFCSIIQELLERAHHGKFEHGTSQNSELAGSVRLQIYRRYIEFVSRQSSAAAKQEHHRSNSQPQDQGQQSPTSGTEAPRRRSRLEIHTEPPMPHIRVTARDPPSSSAAALPVTSTSSPTSTVLQKGADLSNSRESQGRVLDPALAATPQRPSISHVIPNSGTMTGGQPIAVFGSHFLPSHQCFFGLKEATVVERRADSLICSLPARAIPGPVSVTIRETSPIGGLSNSAQFTYQ